MEDARNKCCNFISHWDEERIVALVHQTFEVLKLLVEFLLDVMFHFMRDQPTCDFLAYLRHNSEIIRREVLATLFVCNFKTTDGVVAELDWNKEDVLDCLVESLVDLEVVTQFLTDIITLNLAEMLGLARVED